MRRKPRRIDAGYLERAALYYLERFSASSDSLRRVLDRKVVRAARFHEDDPAEGRALIEALIVRLQNLGYLDDTRYARTSAQSQFRRGRSLRSIRMTLHTKGIDPDTIEDAVQSVRDEAETPDTDLQAAVTLVRRRKLGPFRTPEARQERYQRDLATLARAGFSSEVARSVLSVETPEDLEGLIDDV